MNATEGRMKNMRAGSARWNTTGYTDEREGGTESEGMQDTKDGDGGGEWRWGTATKGGCYQAG